MTHKRYYIEKLGCAKNQVDAEIIAARLDDAGLQYVEDAGAADLIIINSCGFIEAARQEAVNVALSARADYPKARILFAGCMAQRYGARLLEEMTEIDGVFGNYAVDDITDILEPLFEDKRPVLLPEEAKLSCNRNRLFSFPGSSYLRISEGCNHFCSYCAIPLIRGSLRSVPMEQIVEEAARLIRNGVKEINLVAQDLAAYGTDQGTASLFPELLRRLSSLEGEFWLRMLYIHPDHFPKEIFPILRADSRILPYFDIPLQHAHPKILSSMGRRGDAAGYLALIREIRSALPDATIRSTFLLGYPGEGRKEAAALESFIAEARLDWAGFFLFSREEGTRAAFLRGPLMHRLAMPAAERRLRRFQELQESISMERAASRVGIETKVLIEEPVKEEDVALGRAWFQAPEVDGATVVSAPDLKAGDWMTCRIVRSNGFDLEAVCV